MTVTVDGPGRCELACAGRCVDAGSACAPLAAQVVCYREVLARQPIDVEVTLMPTGRDCYCEQEMSCREMLDGREGISLETMLCPEESDCRACQPPPVGHCSLRPREVGLERVRIEGSDAFDLEVSPVGIPTLGSCVRAAQIDACGAIWPPRSFLADRACHPANAAPGTRVPIRVEAECGGCEPIGPCTVDVIGDRILVRPTTLASACDRECPAVCEHTEHVCVTPALPEGRYEVLIDWLTVNDELPPSTIDVSPHGGFVEVCRGSRS